MDEKEETRWAANMVIPPGLSKRDKASSSQSVSQSVRSSVSDSYESMEGEHFWKRWRVTHNRMRRMWWANWWKTRTLASDSVWDFGQQLSKAHAMPTASSGVVEYTWNLDFFSACTGIEVRSDIRRACVNNTQHHKAADYATISSDARTALPQCINEWKTNSRTAMNTSQRNESNSEDGIRDLHPWRIRHLWRWRRHRWHIGVDKQSVHRGLQWGTQP